MDVRAFYRRRLGRLLVAGLFWSLVYWAWRVHFHGEHVPPDEFIRSVLVAKPYAHLHFLFVIIGLYLVTPLLWAFVGSASRTRLRLAVVLALALAAIHQALGLVDLTVPRTLVTHFLPYVGYFLAGFLLRDVRLDRRRSILALGLFAAAVGLGVVGSTVLRAAFGPDEANTALGYFSVSTIITTIVVFLLFRTWLGPERTATDAVPGWIGPVAAATFGVYLVHPIVLDLWRTVVPIGAGRFAPILIFPLSVAVVGLVTLAVVLVARQVPVVRRVVP
jgi:surface polysaccharide O-acyltransferase-like enzyme